MADDSSDQPESWEDVGEQLAAGAAKHATLDAVTDMSANALLKALGALTGYLKQGSKVIAADGGKLLVDLEEPILPIFAAFVAPIVANMFGTEASAESFASRNNREARGGAAAAVVDAYMQALAGDGGGDLQPGDDGARRIAGAGVHAALEGWFNAWILEMLGDLVPWDWLKFHEMTALPEEIIQSLGIGRLTRRALSPLVDVVAATPMRWKVHKQYTPTLLTASTVARQWARGRWDWPDVVEELARAGYSQARIDAIINEQRKFISASEADVLARHIGADTFDAVEYLGEAGYETADAQRALLVEETKRIEQQETAQATVAIDAYASRRIDQGEFESTIDSVVTPAAEKDRFKQQGELKRLFAVKYMTGPEVAACVKKGILPISYYRDTLTREGYPDAEVIAQELLLELEMNTALDVEKAKQQKAADAAAAKQAKADATKAHQQQIEQERAIAKLGPVSELVRAVVRGLIPMARLVEVLQAHYDADTVNIYVADATAQRTAYLAQQAKADAVKKRAAVRHVDVSQLEQGVLDGVLTIDQYRSGLGALNFAPADVDTLAGVLQVKVTDHKAALQHQAQAKAIADAKGVSLPAFEALVRAGHRTVAEYDQLLQSLGVDDAARANTIDLLNTRIAADQAAAAKRAELAKQSKDKGLSLEQARRAVILGVQSIEQFQAWLAGQKYTVDAQIVLTDELRDDVAAADAARKKRATPGVPAAAGHLSLATAAKAAKLGIITPAAYQARLVAAGYSADDVALDMDLLVQEIADVQAKRAKAADVTLADLAKAVKAAADPEAPTHGQVTIDDYQARAIALGYDASAVADLVGVLTDELATQAEARARRATIDGELAAKHLSLSDLQKAVKGGERTLAQFTQQLLTWGYGDADSQLLTDLLRAQLP